jgi:YidC/Oxa1 family membrane protein insertase
VIAISWFQAILQALGAALAAFYSVVGNYGLAIILFTLAIRLVLVPLGIKQIKSMREMQAIQPKIKSLQQKYKGNRQKQQEETMKLYKEHGVNPLMGCLPLLAQFPILIALFAVLQFPKGMTHIPHSNSNPVVGQPQDSRLYVDIREQKTTFLGANLLCNATQAGKQVKVDPKRYHVPDAPRTLNCGNGPASRIPYYVFALAMIGTTYYQQRQMQRATPQGNQQQQALTKFMPLLFGFWGLIFPAGLVIYWTTTNLVQIGQQHFMLPRLQDAPTAAKATGDGGGSRAKGSTGPGGGVGGGGRKGGRGGGGGGRSGDARRPNGGEAKQRGSAKDFGDGKSSSASSSLSGQESLAEEPKPVARDRQQLGSSRSPRNPGSRRAGGSNGGSRKKRRKR